MGDLNASEMSFAAVVMKDISIRKRIKWKEYNIREEAKEGMCAAEGIEWFMILNFTPRLHFNNSTVSNDMLLCTMRVRLWAIQHWTALSDQSHVFQLDTDLRITAQ